MKCGQETAVKKARGEKGKEETIRKRKKTTRKEMRSGKQYDEKENEKERMRLRKKTRRKEYGPETMSLEEETGRKKDAVKTKSAVTKENGEERMR